MNYNGLKRLFYLCLSGAVAGGVLMAAEIPLLVQVGCVVSILSSAVGGYCLYRVGFGK